MIKKIIVKNFLNEFLELELTNPEESGFIVKEVTGLGPDKSTINIKEIANGDGGYFNSARTPVRNIVMNLLFIGTPMIEDTRHKSYRYFPMKKPLTLTVVTDRNELSIDGYVESNEPNIFSKEEGCQISILCGNPYFYTKHDQLTTSSGSTPMFEFPVDNELIKNGDQLLDADISDDTTTIITVAEVLGNINTGYFNWPWDIALFEEKTLYTLSFFVDSNFLRKEIESSNVRTANIYLYVYYEPLSGLYDIKHKSLTVVDVGSYLKNDANSVANYNLLKEKFKVDVELTENELQRIYKDKKIFLGTYSVLSYRNGGTTNSGGSSIYGEVKLYDMSIYKEQKTDIHVDKFMPNYTFEQDGSSYNLQVSKGFIMGDIQKYGFNHQVKYDGNASIGYQMTIRFTHSLVQINDDGSMDEDPGYIVITSNYYPREKMVIDLKKIQELLPRGISGDKNLIPPVAQQGDLIFIDTRKKKKMIRYQKPYGFSYTTSAGSYVIWDYADYKMNILAASNRDIEWFELNQGTNIFTIRHTFDPEREVLTNEELEKVHSEYLEVEVRNQVYYEGV